MIESLLYRSSSASIPRLQLCHLHTKNETSGPIIPSGVKITKEKLDVHAENLTGINHHHDHDHDHDQDLEDEMEQEDMFVTPDVSLGTDKIEWGGPRRGGRYAEPTRFGDWERKGRCTDF